VKSVRFRRIPRYRNPGCPSNRRKRSSGLVGVAGGQKPRLVVLKSTLTRIRSYSDARTAVVIQLDVPELVGKGLVLFFRQGDVLLQ